MLIIHKYRNKYYNIFLHRIAHTMKLQLKLNKILKKVASTAELTGHRGRWLGQRRKEGKEKKVRKSQAGLLVLACNVLLWPGGYLRNVNRSLLSH